VSHANSATNVLQVCRLRQERNVKQTGVLLETIKAMEEVQSENGGEEVNRPVNDQTSVLHIILRDGNSHLYQIPIIKVFLQKMTFTSAFVNALDCSQRAARLFTVKYLACS
jgi:hypothetical protein